MKTEKTYILTWFYCGKSEEIIKGSPALCQREKTKLSKISQYRKGKFTIISEDGLKYNKNYIK